MRNRSSLVQVMVAALLAAASMPVVKARLARSGEPVAVAAAKPNSVSAQYVFGTDKLTRYQFPTHLADLVVDRAQASCSEVFIVVIRPTHASPRHRHDDMEQIFYVLEGKGTVIIGDDKKEFPIKPGDVVRVPMMTYHSVRTEGNENLKYLCVDCLGSNLAKNEPTWDDHIKTYCRKAGLDFQKVVMPGRGGSSVK